MNYLAHLYLSGLNDNVRFGNMIGDFVKGNNYKNFPEDIKKGILLHRDIDSYTDRHKIISESKKLFAPKYHKHAGIVIDIVFDHFLARNWEIYSEKNLQAFARHAYLILVRNHKLIPSKVKYFLPFMIVNNWLVSYKNIEFIRKVFTRMPYRTSLPDESKFCMETFKNNYDWLENNFFTFFSELMKYVNEKHNP
ncbi:MAG: ACP phosphodiesterase [Bacteroidota bacterium]